MKLRNKKTGEIADLSEGFIRDTYNGEMIQIKPVAISNKEGYVYDSLAKLNAEWEDYEEPKETKVFWYIEDDGDVLSIRTELCDELEIHTMKQIGNYFETKEEAKLAVRKLKAWKRLKDKGFRFTGINDDEDSQELITQCGILCEADIYPLAKDEDFLLLFGGEE